MAALTGYLIGKTGSATKAAYYLPTIFADVFSPEIQEYGDVESPYVSDSILLANSAISRPAAQTKTPPYTRALEGSGGVGPAGERIGRYTDDFYHRIHITPSVLKLGNLTSAQTRDVEVWNAFFHTVDLENVQSINADGITVTPPVSPVYTMAALEFLVYEVEVSNDGPPSIEATIRWTIDGLDYDLEITGERVVSILFDPNWVNGMEETLEWKTDIIKSYNGEEQRSQIRSKARRGQTYNYTLIGDECASLENLLWGWQARLFAVPHWSDTTLSQTDLFEGQTVISTDTEHYSYGETGLFLLTDGVSYEMQEIDSIAPGEVTLSKGLDRDWMAPVVIGPVNIARIDGDFSVSTKRETATILTTSIKFIHEPVSTDPFIPYAAESDTYLSKELWLKEPNWKGGLGVKFESDGVVMDFGLSSFATSERHGKPEIVREYEWLLKNRTDMLEFRQFLARRAGRMFGFWMPSWTQDFIITQDVTSGTFGFTAQENTYGLLVAGSTGRNHVVVVLKDGTKIYKEISSATIDGDEVNVITTESMGVDFSPSDVVIVSMLGWYRLFTDKVTVKYLDRNVATVQTSLVNILP